MCQGMEMITCEKSRRCKNKEDARNNIFCNATEYLCLDRETSCNTVHDCPYQDNSDENGCKYFHCFKRLILPVDNAGGFKEWI